MCAQAHFSYEPAPPGRLNDLVPNPNPSYQDQAFPRPISDGFRFTEGPVWHPDGYLLFSDIPASTIYRINVPYQQAHGPWNTGGQIGIFLSPSGNSNGLTFDPQGKLLACEHGGRRVSRMGADGKMETVADSYNGKRLNSPNDIVCHSSGRIYFTDPPYGIDPDPGEQGFNGVYRIDPDGAVVLLYSDFDRPNGLAFSPDESKLYINDSHRRHIRVSDVNPDGSLSNDRVFIDMNVEAEGNPDGMKLDTQGNVYCTGGGGIWVIDPSGDHLGTIPVPEQPANLAFGSADLTVLYITARTTIYSIQLAVPGVAPAGGGRHIHGGTFRTVPN